MAPVAFAGAADAELSAAGDGGAFLSVAETIATAPIDAAAKKTAEPITRKDLRLRFARGLYLIGGAAADLL